MSHELAITVKAQVSELRRVCQLVESFCAERHVGPSLVWRVLLALEELWTNAISYGYESPAEHELRITLVLDGAKLVLTFEDDGHAFNPLELAAPELDIPLEERRVGGLGIYLVRSMMDDVEYQRREGRNCVIMSLVTTMAPAAP